MSINSTKALKHVFQKIKMQEKLIGKESEYSKYKPQLKRETSNYNNKYDHSKYSEEEYSESAQTPRIRKSKHENSTDKYSNNLYKGFYYSKTKNEYKDKIDNFYSDPRYSYKIDKTSIMRSKSHDLLKTKKSKYEMSENDHDLKLPNISRSNQEFKYKPNSNQKNNIGYNLMNYNKISPLVLKDMNSINKLIEKRKLAYLTKRKINLIGIDDLDFEADLNELETKIRKNFDFIEDESSSAKQNAIKASRKNQIYEYIHNKIIDELGISQEVQKMSSQYVLYTDKREKLNYVYRDDAKAWNNNKNNAITNYRYLYGTDEIEDESAKFYKKNKKFTVDHQKKKDKEVEESLNKPWDVKEDFVMNFNWSFRDPKF